jgi:CubicO group peptidase (beta-lactamase class C family)
VNGTTKGKTNFNSSFNSSVNHVSPTICNMHSLMVEKLWCPVKRAKTIQMTKYLSGLLGTSTSNATLYGDNDTYSHDTFLDQLANQNLKADPGAYSVYSNDGFTLAEILVERVSGIGFTAFIHQYFTEPLDMKHTKTPQDVVGPAEMAGIYSPFYEGQLPKENYNIIATGGLYSTAEDLVKFSQIFTGEVNGILSSSL